MMYEKDTAILDCGCENVKRDDTLCDIAKTIHEMVYKANDVANAIKGTMFQAENEGISPSREIACLSDELLGTRDDLGTLLNKLCYIKERL